MHLAALLAALAVAAPASTTNQIRVFSDQLPDGMPPALVDFAATHHAGAQKLGAYKLPAQARLETPSGGGAVPESGVLPSSWGMHETTVSTVTLAPRRAAVLLH